MTKRHAIQVRRSRLMAHPMSDTEWVLMLLRASDYEGGWPAYLDKARKPYWKDKTRIKR